MLNEYKRWEKLKTNNKIRKLNRTHFSKKKRPLSKDSLLAKKKYGFCFGYIGVI